MAADELILPGFVSDADLVALYNLAKVFVFPSWHEGFGLPVLEAMACGTAVIAANTSSLPEVVGREDALFDPMDGVSIASSLGRVLTDESFRADLRAYGPRRARMFSWSETAGRALEAFETSARRRLSIPA
jgi:glycosyltransferase involved in cell wall biosynthesis